MSNLVVYPNSLLHKHLNDMRLIKLFIQTRP